VRGDQHARRVQAFSNSYSNNQSITFRPDSVFHLVSSAYNRIILNIHPRKLGNHRALINLIDVDSKELLSCWLVSIHAQAPAVMRTYDVEVPIGQVLYKKILFKNLWESHRKYIVSSSDENLMRSRNATVDVGPQGAAYLRLWFNSWPEGLAGVREVYLFLNDYDSGNNEECNLFRLHAAH
jgi:nephrocystin-4